jgi:hypothetical protein
MGLSRPVKGKAFFKPIMKRGTHFYLLQLQDVL